MSYLTDYDAALNNDFQKKVTVALYAAASAIKGEATSPNAEVDLRRGDLAYRVLVNGQNFVQQFCLALVGLGITGASTDSAIFNGIAGLWNKFANIDQRTGT